jgi:septin family protein
MNSDFDELKNLMVDSLLIEIIELTSVIVFGSWVILRVVCP